MIKTGGENVASREVEEVLYRHTGVQEVAVFGLAHPVWVEAVVAAVVPRDGVDAHRGRHAGPLPGTPGRVQDPQQVFFVDALPKNPSGKLLKRALRERFSLESTSH